MTEFLHLHIRGRDGCALRASIRTILEQELNQRGWDRMNDPEQSERAVVISPSAGGDWIAVSDSEQESTLSHEVGWTERLAVIFAKALDVPALVGSIFDGAYELRLHLPSGRGPRFYDGGGVYADSRENDWPVAEPEATERLATASVAFPPC